MIRRVLPAKRARLGELHGSGIKVKGGVSRNEMFIKHGVLS